MSPPVADSVRGHWVERLAPVSVRPYLRLARIDRPVGWWLLLLPCWWSTALAAMAMDAPYPDPRLLVLFTIGAIAMRGAGCTWNDILDRKIDRQVARTRNRPLASGDVSVPAALAFLVAQALVGLAVLLSLPHFAIVTGLASLGVVAVYPLMKRITSIPQLTLGIAFSWGALMGWASVLRTISDPALLLFAGCVAWVFAYDTIYAHQDKEDDALIGVRSTALRLGGATRPWLGGFYAGMLALLVAAAILAGLGPLFYAGLAATVWLLARQVRRVDLDDPADCLGHFRANRPLGLVVTAALLAGHVTL